MEQFKVSPLWTRWIKNFGRDKMDPIFWITFALECLGAAIYIIFDWQWMLIFPLFFPVMPFVLFRVAVQIRENIRIKRYCKRVGITTEQFNAEYINGSH